MFETGGLAELGAAEAADEIAAAFQAILAGECRLLLLAAHWADLHGWDADLDLPRPGRERTRQVGGVGTPWVLEFAAAELGALQQTTTGAGYALIGDALDLRHRFPRLWAKVHAGGVRVWQARKIATATRHLSVEAAAAVDAAVTPSVGMLPWGRLEPLLAAAVVAADPAQAAEQARLYDTDRFVRTGRSRHGGLLTLVARANAGDVIWFLAMVHRIADLLRLDGDHDSADVRRSKAIGLLARPAAALALLIAHRNDTDSRDTTEPGTTHPRGHDPEVEPSTHQTVDLTPPPELAGLGSPLKARPTEEPAPVGWHLPATGLDYPGHIPDDLGKWQPSPRTEHDDSHRHGRSAEGSAPELWFGVLLPTDTVEADWPPRHAHDQGRRCTPVPQIDPDRLLPPAVLYLHLSAESFHADPDTETGVARMEGVGPITIGQARRFLTHTGQIRIHPVIDPTDTAPADSYEIPHRLRRAMLQRNPIDVFPYGTTPTRHADLDHTIPFLRPHNGGPSEQTALDNLGPLNRHHHRIKTHSRWRVRQPTPGTYLWKTPSGHIYLVTPAGTQALGRSPFAAGVWQAATGRREAHPAASGPSRSGAPRERRKAPRRTASQQTASRQDKTTPAATRRAATPPGAATSLTDAGPQLEVGALRVSS